ncbi:MAG: hypothetical protein DRJ09_10895 [Bacteroidetes bacterium]|nr:MAG: hypothetical protein DRJ09_10895 [Bacteroidota bacterium]
MMKKTMNFLVLFAFIAALSIYVSGCEKTTTEAPGDNTALNALITQSETLIASAVEGTSVGYYEVGSKETFQTAIDAAKVVAADATAIQSVIDAAKANLDAAKTVFENKKILNVSTDGLVAQWLFNGDATDFTGNGNDGTVKAGDAAFGGGTPELTTDRFGNENSAYHFDKGGFIDIPYTSAINPQQISISIWVNADVISENNRFMGLQSWNGYKFQLQSVNKAFFTVATDSSIYDKDTDPPLDTLTWYNLAVTYKSGEMTFYINGEQTQQYTDVVGNLVSVDAGQDLAIGCGASVYAATADNYDVDHIIPAAWGGFFIGKLDDIRLYNRVLTPSEVSSIYNLEKP